MLPRTRTHSTLIGKVRDRSHNRRGSLSHNPHDGREVPAAGSEKHGENQGPGGFDAQPLTRTRSPEKASIAQQERRGVVPQPGPEYTRGEPIHPLPTFALFTGLPPATTNKEMR